MPLDAAEKREIRPSTCPHDCPSACALDVELNHDGRIGRVRGAKENDYTDGVICEKVARYGERVHHPDRLKQPLRRVGEKGLGISAFQPISWDDALDEVAEGFVRAQQTYGSESVWPYNYAGTMGLVQRDGIERLRFSMKASRQHSTICIALSDAGWKAGCGAKRGVDAREIAKSDLIVVWGGNPVSTQINVMNLITRARKDHGAKLVVVDPYRTGTAAQADMHLMVKPGTDDALAAAVIHQILKEGMADRDYLAAYSDWGPDLEAKYEACTPSWASGITGVPEEQIIAFARLYGATKKSYIRVGYGFSRSRNGAVSVHSVVCLPTVTGAWQYEGGGALYGQTMVYPLDHTLIQGLDVLDRSTRILDQSRFGPVLEGDKRDLGEGPPVTALFIQNTNPMAVCPDGGSVARGMARSDLFTCVHEQFMTETAAMADIVIPAPTSMEYDDLYIATGHTYLQATRKVIEPLGERRSNHDVICALAKRLGLRHRGFEMTAWEIIDETLRMSGLGDADSLAEGRWRDCALPYETMHFLDGFATPDKRFHFKPDWSRIGPAHENLPKGPGHFDNTDNADEEHPFRLVTAPARAFLNTSFTETPGSLSREKKPRVKIHPDAAGRLSVKDDDLLRLGNKRADVVVAVEIFDGLQEDVLVVEGIWPNTAFVEGRGINHLVSADPAPPNGGAVFHDTAVWARRV